MKKKGALLKPQSAITCSLYVINTLLLLKKYYPFHLASWTEWKSQGCSASCGEGLEEFTRLCVGAGECDGDDTKIEPCTDLPVCGRNTHTSMKVKQL